MTTKNVEILSCPYCLPVSEFTCMTKHIIKYQGADLLLCLRCETTN